VTAYSEYAIRALREKAYDYLLKPIQPTELMDCIKRFEAETRKQPGRFLLVKQQGFTVPVALNEIVYLEAKGPYSKIFLVNNNQYLMSKTLKILNDLLSNDFIRIHRSFLVNKAMVQSFKKDNLITTTNVCLPVSRLGSKILSQYF
jgi:two-component system, LytTR family, response regulator